jgi:hypothetical protein
MTKVGNRYGIVEQNVSEILTFVGFVPVLVAIKLRPLLVVVGLDM